MPRRQMHLAWRRIHASYQAQLALLRTRYLTVLRLLFLIILRHASFASANSQIPTDAYARARAPRHTGLPNGRGLP